MNFEEYLQSKKIDSAAFKAAEGDLWATWNKEFVLMHPSSFTSQKLYLINPIRRKYQLMVVESKLPVETVPPEIKREPPTELIQAGSDTAAIETNRLTTDEPPKAKPAVPRPVFKPKPKMN